MSPAAGEEVAASALQSRVRRARELLGVERLVFAIHDASFPGGPDEDTGRGTPYSREALRLLRFVGDLGFDGVQLGPQGEMEPGATSPYEGALFARSTLSVALARLADDDPWAGLLEREQADALVGAAREANGAPADRADPSAAERARGAGLAAAFAAFRRRAARGDPALAGVAERLAAFEREQADWLDRHALYEALCAEHGSPDWRGWEGPGETELDARLFSAPAGRAAEAEARKDTLRRRHAEPMAFARFAQLVAHEQHAQLRRAAAGLGLLLLGDLQVGASWRDEWGWRSLFLPGYRMGAPPSRTNPEGQPWHYPVFDPRQIHDEGGAPGPVLRFLARRLDKAFAEYDALRVDHPHGFVCPWVYRVDDDAGDAAQAVQRGARLFSSPDLADHLALKDFAIAHRADLDSDPATPRHADRWVARLSDEQVARYAVLFDALVDAARRAGRDAHAIVCEVLSTMPYPLARVLARHGLGRFRVTQKADLHDPADVYRSENAAPADWVMLGTHDTPPLWRRLEEWQRSGGLAERAAWLAGRLAPGDREREPLREALARDPGLVAQAQLADLFACPARNVMIFWADLFGVREVYNAPGTVGSSNWTLRLPPSWERDWRERCAAGRALDIPRALALALRARAAELGDEARALADRLERDARAARREG